MGSFFSSPEEVKYWYRNGQLRERRVYIDGEIEGENTVWYQNGQIQRQEFYRNGEREETKSYYENGQMMKHEFYRNGR